MPPCLFDAMPLTWPEAIAPETFLIPNLALRPDGLFLPVNAMVIRGREPVIVDTGALVHRAMWIVDGLPCFTPGPLEATLSEAG